MASKKKPLVRKTQGFGVKNPITEMSKAQALIVRKKWAEARNLLLELSQSYPQNTEILSLLVNVCYEIKDIPAYTNACERLVKADPNNSDATFALAGGYITSLHPMLALQTFRHALNRWPKHEKAAEVRTLVAELEANVDELLSEINLTGEKGIELAILHERGQAYLEQGEYKKARQAEEELLRERPDFISAYNNLSLISFIEGNVDEAILLWSRFAIAISHKVLDMQPDNIHALSNLTRYHCLKGELEQAKPFAERLKASEAKAWDTWTKKLEALSYLGDDDSIVEVYEQVLASGELKSKRENAIFYHLVAVAMARQGNMQQAREQWQQALKRTPGFELAQENLDDLKRPIALRHVPWPFNLGNWVTKQTINDLATAVVPTAKSNDEKEVAKATERYLAENPQIAHLVPILLDRGDPQGREFAFRLASIAKTPEMLTALRDFALSQRGPDEMRHQAALKVSEAGLLPSEGVRLWLQGEWLEVSLISYELHNEPTATYSRQVQQWLAEAISLMKKGDAKDGEEAERLLKQALEVEPDAPALLNNLAASYEVQGRTEEGIVLMHQIIERFPDYVFARVSVARSHIIQGEIEAAEALLKPLLSRKRFHFDEFANFSNGYIELLLAQKREDAARAWLKMWEGVDPENSQIMMWKLRLEGPSILKKLSNLSKWGAPKK